MTQSVTYEVRVFNERRNVGEMMAVEVPARWIWSRSSSGIVEVSPSSVEAEQIGVPAHVVAELAQRLSSLPVNTWVRVGPSRPEPPRPEVRLTPEELRMLREDERAMRRYAAGIRREEAEWRRAQKKDNPMYPDNPCVPCGAAANPLPASAWPWLVGGAVVVGAAWLYLKKKTTWTCRAAMACTHFVKGDNWHVRNKIDNSLSIYSTPPENFNTLTLEETAPDGSYHTYVLEKPAVALPDFTP